MLKYTLLVVLFSALVLVGCAQATPTQEPLPPMECNVVGLLPPLDPTQEALFPPVSDEEWAKGADNPTLTIVEYSDFQ